MSLGTLGTPLRYQVQPSVCGDHLLIAIVRSPPIDSVDRSRGRSPLNKPPGSDHAKRQAPLGREYDPRWVDRVHRLPDPSDRPVREPFLGMPARGTFLSYTTSRRTMLQYRSLPEEACIAITARAWWS